MDVVEMVLGGRVNKGLVTLIQQAGANAVGLCGKDSGTIKARQVSALPARRRAAPDLAQAAPGRCTIY
jgi:acetylglutamate kinase